MIDRRALLAGLLLGAGGAAAPLVADELRRSPRPMPRGALRVPTPPSAEALVAAAALPGTMGYAVIDARTGRVLDERDAATPMPPGSVAKVVTTLYALDRLGAAHRFVTRVIGTGPVADGVLQGDLVLVGGGDPRPGTDDFAELAGGLRARGLRGITGRFLYHDAALPRVARIDDDQPVQAAYNPAISGLNVNFNRLRFGWTRAGGGWTVVMDARGRHFAPRPGVASMQVVQRRAPPFTYERRGDHEAWTVAAAALGNGGERWLPTRLPGLCAALVFRDLAAAHGITLSAPERVAGIPRGQELGRITGAALAEVLEEMLYWSTNLVAECCGLAASGRGDLRASAGAMTDWARAAHGMRGRLVDHSGLGVASRLSAMDMVRMLRGAGGGGLRPLLRDIGMRDGNGRKIEGHPVRVVAKSGTLDFVSALAGHILRPDGRDLIFAVFAADLARRDRLRGTGSEAPPGSREWLRRARLLQGQLVSRWAVLADGA